MTLFSRRPMRTRFAPRHKLILTFKAVFLFLFEVSGYNYMKCHLREHPPHSLPTTTPCVRWNSVVAALAPSGYNPKTINHRSLMFRPHRPTAGDFTERRFKMHNPPPPPRPTHSLSWVLLLPAGDPGRTAPIGGVDGP